MRKFIQGVCLACLMYSGHGAVAVDLQFIATQEDMDIWPCYQYPQCGITPWRSDSEANFYSKSGEIGDRYYAQDGWAMFGTQFSFPNANPPGVANGSLPPEIVISDPNFDNLINLPSFVSQHQILSSRIAAGWSYSLIDDPRMQAGIRYWTFDGTNYPPPDGTNTTGVVPYVKLGILDGVDILGNNPVFAPSARWGFEVGANVPPHFRIGVMTDGLDGAEHSPGEVFMSHVVDQVPVATVSTGTLAPNRRVDMHFFDIINAQPGDQFVFSAMTTATGINAGISGFSFDILVPFVSEGADFDSDGDVDGRDFLAWQRGESPNQFSASDLELWQNEYGNGSLAAVSIPEPASICLVLSALLCCSRPRR